MRETMSLADRPASDSSLVWFSGVMATGIAALALRDAGLDTLSWLAVSFGFGRATARLAVRWKSANQSPWNA
jgi:hypothetical protein